MHAFTTLDGVPVVRSNEHDIVPWWSFTKPVLATAALTLVRDGLVQLDDAVLDAPYTLRQLLRHESGLADYGDLADYHRAVSSGAPPWSAEELMERLDGKRLRDPPGINWWYSNVGYMQVASLVSKLTGLDLAAALKERVLRPLGMKNTRLARTRADLKQVQMGRTEGYDPGWVYHGLLIGPLPDAVLFLDNVFGGQLLPDSLVAEMTTPRILGGPLNGRPWTVAGYGLGLMQGEWSADMVVHGHTGRGPGSSVAVYHHRRGNRSACAAVFHDSEDEGSTEAQVKQSLLDALAGSSGHHHH